MEKSLKLIKTIYGEFTSNMAQRYNNFGCAYQKIHQYEEALGYHKKSYEIRKKLKKNCSDFDLSWVLIPYSNVANCYFFLKKYEESYRIAKKIFEKREKILSKNYIQLVQIKILLMDCLVKLNKIDEAKNIYQDLLAVVSAPNVSVGIYTKEYIEKDWNILFSK